MSVEVFWDLILLQVGVVGMANANSLIYRYSDLEDQLFHSDARVALFDEPKFWSKFVARVSASLPNRDPVLSLDVFDTLILRDSSSEIRRFLEIGQRMAAQLIAHRYRPKKRKQPTEISDLGFDAFLARHFGTLASYRAREQINGSREGSLYDIHNVASRLLTGTDSMRDAFVTSEIDYERTRVAPNTSLASLARELRSSGIKVILLSDMYMHASQIRDLLDSIGIDSDQFDLILSSADTHVSKASGGIFAIAENSLGLGPGNFFHIGDSFVGDFVQPKKRGWRALHLPLSDKEVQERRKDHVETAAMIESRFGVAVDIALPKAA